MSCCQRLFARSHARKTLERGALPAVLSGTWDYKWPQGTSLRIAFQELPDDAQGLPVAPRQYLDHCVELFWQKLAEWKVHELRNLSVNRERTLWMPAPSRASASPRSAKSALNPGDRALEYDVLVSFMPLPLTLPETAQHAAVTLHGEVAELGRYAKRIEYGVPTAFLGPRAGFEGAWWQSPDGLFTIAHEIGHILGLAHEQQNPRLTPLPWRDAAELTKVAQLRGAANFQNLEEFLAAELIRPWPGELAFSDWRQQPSAASAYPFELDSIMAHPTFRCLLQGGHRDANSGNPYDCQHDAVCPFATQDLQRLQGPTDSDRQQLASMYG